MSLEKAANQHINLNENKIINPGLFTFKDIDGNEQFEVVEKIGKFGDYLRKKDPRVIGVSVSGSTVKGYAHPESGGESDVDFYIIYDDSNPNVSSLEGSDVIKNTKGKYLPEFSEENKIELHHLTYNGLDMARLNPHAIVNAPAIIKPLIFPVFGDIDKIKKCIEVVKDAIEGLSPEEKEKWVDKFAGIATGDTYEADKFLTRKGIGFTPQNAEEYRDMKKEMYKQRIKKLFID